MCSSTLRSVLLGRALVRCVGHYLTGRLRSRACSSELRLARYPLPPPCEGPTNKCVFRKQTVLSRSVDDIHTLKSFIVGGHGELSRSHLRDRLGVSEIFPHMHMCAVCSFRYVAQRRLKLLAYTCISYSCTCTIPPSSGELAFSDKPSSRFGSIAHGPREPEHVCSELSLTYSRSLYGF